MIKLRPYQIKARKSVIEEWEKGILNTLLASAVGSGKTEMFLSILAANLGTGRALIIAHRQELIYQPRDRIVDHWPGLVPAGVVMGVQNDVACRVIIATIQTLAVPGRLDQILEYGPITHLVTDEAHHSTANTYREVYRVLREANPTMRHLGVTATPRRTDGDGLSQIYQSIAYRFGIKKAIKIGALVPFTAIGVHLPVSLADVREVGEGWDDGELGEVLKARNAEEIIVETWEKHAKDRPTIAFTASVAQAYSLAERFREYGHGFQALDGTTPKAERAALLAAFKGGKVQGIINCAVLTEGFDAPHASCLVQVRPTRSDLVYVQMAGRVLRTAPGKPDALLLDFVPEDARELRLAGDLLGKPKEQRKKEQKAEDDGIVLSCFGINSGGEGLDGDPDEVIMKVLDYLSASRLAWVFDGDIATAAAGGKTSLAVRMPDSAIAARLEKADGIKAGGDWDREWDAIYRALFAQIQYRLYAIKRYHAEPLGEYATWEAASDAAEDYIDSVGLDVLSKKGSTWRRSPASDKQRALLVKFHLWKEGMSKGRAAQAITHHFCRRALRV